MSDDVLSLFEGLTPTQARELRQRIILALPELRREVLDQNPGDLGKSNAYPRSHLGSLSSNQTDQQRTPNQTDQQRTPLVGKS